MADEGRWVTVRGRRVFIKDGETPSQAIERSKKYEKKFYGSKSGAFNPKYRDQAIAKGKMSTRSIAEQKEAEKRMKKAVDAELKKLGITREQASKDLYAEHTRRDHFLNKDGSKKKEKSGTKRVVSREEYAKEVDKRSRRGR